MSASLVTTQSSALDYIFCAIVGGQVEASIVYEDEVAVVFMDLHPVTPGHLLIVPRGHMVGLEDLDEATVSHLWAVGHRMAKALSRCGLRCEGINVFLADGKAALQEVLHFLPHVFPRYAGDGFTIGAHWAERSRNLLNAEAEAVKKTLALGPTLH